MKKLALIALFLGLILGGIFLLSQSSGEEGNSCSSANMDDRRNTMCSSPLVDYGCDDPGQTARNICKLKYTVQRCKDICANEAKQICSWNANKIENCKAQCLTVNGCKP